MAEQRSWKKRSWWLSAMYVGFMVVLLVWMYGSAQEQVHAGRKTAVRASTGADSVTGDRTLTEAELQLQAQRLEVQRGDLDRLQDYLKQRTDDLEHVIATLTLSSSVYTALLGLFAYFGLKQAKEDAEAQIKRFEKDGETRRQQEEKDHLERIKQFDELKSEIRADIPSLMDMQKTLSQVLNGVRTRVDLTRVWTGASGSDSYNSMQEEERQKVLLAEMTVASLDYFRILADERNAKIAARIFAGLAHFYTARGRSAGDVYVESDMKRASVYIARACEMDAKNAYLLTQRAAFILNDLTGLRDRPSEAQLSAALEHVQASLEIEADFPAALYNLAWIQDERGQFPEAIATLDALIAQKETLPAAERGRRLTLAYLNRACARAKLLLARRAAGWGEGSEEAEIGRILDDCRDANVEAQQSGDPKEWKQCRRDMEREWGEGGDLAQLKPLLSPERQATLMTLTR